MPNPGGPRFTYGVMRYDGADVESFGAGLSAAPLSCLWGEM
jgi:hypothetical protein